MYCGKTLILMAAGKAWHESTHEQASPTSTLAQSESTAQDWS
jgi:hypothetical protein